MSSKIDWEDKYWRLKTDYDDLQAVCNKQTEEIRKMKTKTVKLENDFAQLSRANGQPVVPSRQRNNDEDQQRLEDDNRRLKTRVNKLIDEVKGQKEELEKKKREVSNLKRIAASRKLDSVNNSTLTGKKRPATAGEVVASQGPTQRQAAEEVHTSTLSTAAPPQLGDDTSHMALLNSYKTRMLNAEKLVTALRQELSEAHDKVAHSSTLRESHHGHESSDTQWRLQQLQTQYDHLQARASAQDKMYKDSERKVEEFAQRIRDLRRVLEDLRNEKEITDIKATRVDELEEQMMELRKLNRNLEDKISRLCEAPFINNAFGKEEARMRYEEVESEREQYRLKVDHLQEAVKTQYSALVALKQQAHTMLEEKNAALHEMDALKAKYKELEEGHQMIQVKLRLYSGKDDDIDLDALERALTLVKKRNMTVEKLDIFNSDIDRELYPDGIVTTEKKLNHVQEINLRLTKEVERLEGMLRIQSDVNRQLHKELEGLVGNRDKDKKELIQRSEGFEEVAKKRLEKIHMLEAQVRQLIYGSKLNGGGFDNNLLLGNEPMGELHMENDIDNPLLNVLIEEKNGEDIQPDENLLEVWVKGANIRDGLIQPGTSTFVVVDFFDYESQATSLLSGGKPQWDFASTYKLTVDDFLLRYFATEVMTFELNMAKQGDFAVIARCTIPLTPLLLQKPLVHVVNHPMVSSETGAVVANITVDIRLAMPIFELYRLFLERHPDEEHQIREIAAKRAVATASMLEKAKGIDNSVQALAATNLEDESRLYNELEIDIIKGSGLVSNRKAGGGSDAPYVPSPYVHFQFLGYPDKFTSPQEGTVDPVYNESFAFPMVTNDQQLRLLRRSQLVFTVIDMKAESSKDSGAASRSRVAAFNSDCVLGEVHLSLHDLIITSSSENDDMKNPSLNGGMIDGVFDVKDTESGEKRGSLELRIHWYSPLRCERQLGARALTGIDVEKIISCFAANDANDGLVNYRYFCRMVSPPRNIRRALEELKSSLCGLADIHHKSHQEIACILFDGQNNDVKNTTLNEVEFVEHLLKLQLPSGDDSSTQGTLSGDILPQELGELFRYIDLDEDNNISVSQLLMMMNLGDSNAIPALLYEKLRGRVRDIEAQNISILSLFENIDKWGADGIISRLDFKQILKQMGFLLVDEVGDASAIEASTFKLHRDQAKGVSKSVVQDEKQHHGDMLNDTINSVGDDVLIGTAAGVELDQVRNERKQAFEAQVREAEARSQYVADEMKQQPEENSEKEGNNDSFVSKPKEDELVIDVSSAMLDPFPGAEHHVGVANMDSGRRFIDNPAAENLATKLQSRYRGYRQRKHGIATPVSPPKKEILKHASEPKSLIVAEERLRKCFETMRSLPNFLAAFETVDTKKTGFVNRMQFAHVMRQFNGISLDAEYLRVFMDFFDTNTDINAGAGGEKINYHAFIQFCEYKPSDSHLPSIKLLNKMILHHDAILSIKKCDVNGTGFINRPSMLRVLANSGYVKVKDNKLLKMLRLFETKTDGEINYGNFIQYNRESKNGALYEQLVRKLCEKFTSEEPPKSARVSTAVFDSSSNRSHFIKGWFDVMICNGDSSLAVTNSMNKAGRASYDDLVNFLNEYELVDSSVPKEVTRCLFISMDATTEGISFDDLITWIRNVPSPTFYNALSDVTMKMSDIQRKSQRYINMVLSEGGYDIVNNYIVYDHKGSNLLPKDIFIHATKQLSGFPYTYNEARSVAAEFAQMPRYKVKLHGKEEEMVNYRKFFDWIQPPSGVAMEAEKRLSDASGNNSESKHKFSPATLSRFLEDAVQRGVDVVSVFGRYDSKSLGRISVVDFAAGLSDLGLSTGFSSSDLIAFADQYNASVSEFILYRRLISTLYDQVDDKTGAASGIDVAEHLFAVLQRNKLSLDVVEDYFQKYDRKMCGRVKEDDLSVILLDDLGLFNHLKRKDIDRIADKYSVANGWIQYTSLMNVLKSKRLGLGGSSKHGAAAFALSDELIHKCRGHLEELILQGVDIRGEFERSDLNANQTRSRSANGSVGLSGLISASYFKHTLQDDFRIKLSVRELDQLEYAYRQSQVSEDAISYHKFLYEMHPHVSSNVDADTWLAAEDLRRKIRRKCPTYTVPQELRRAYRHFSDRGGGGPVTMLHFSEGIRQLGMKMSGHVEQNLFKLICLQGKNSEEEESAFTYAEFAIFTCDPHHRDVIWKLRRFMNRGGKHAHHVDPKEIFNALTDEDSNSSKIISSAHFQRALKRCDISLSGSDVERLLYRFGVNYANTCRGDVDSGDGDFISIKLFMKFVLGQNDFEVGASRLMDDDGKWDGRRSAASDITEWDYNAVTSRSHLDEGNHRILYKKLMERVSDKLSVGFSPDEIYSYFEGDVDGSGRLSRGAGLDIASLLRGMRDIGISHPVSRHDAKSLLRQMCSVVNGTVNRSTFFDSLQIDVNELMLRSSRKDRSHRSRRSESFDEMEKPPVHDSGKMHVSKELQEVLSVLWNELMLVGSNVRASVDPLEMLQACLERYDENADSKINQREFSRAITSLKLQHNFKKDHIIQLYDCLDKNLSGVISIDMLIRHMQWYKKHHMRNVDIVSGGEDSALAGLFRKRPDLKSKIIDTQLHALYEKDINLFVKLKEEYKRMDITNTGVVSASELTGGLYRIGLRLKPEDERDFKDSLIEQYKARTSYNRRAGDSNISYNEFIAGLAAQLKSIHFTDEVLEKFQHDMKMMMKQSRKTLTDVFEYIDRDNDGQIDVVDFERGINRLNLAGNISNDDLKRIFEKMTTGNGVSATVRTFTRVFDKLSADAADARDLDLDSLIRRVRVPLHEKYGSNTNVSKQLKYAYEDVMGGSLGRSGHSRVSKRDFLAIMSSVKSNLLVKEDVDLIFQQMGVREAGGDVVTLNFMDFVHKLEGISNLDASTDSMGGGMHTPRKSSSAVTEEILDGLRRKIQVGHESALSSTGSRKVSIPNVENAFRDCCRENSRDKQFMASKTQFANAMDAVNIHIRAADIEGLFDALNGDRRTTGDDEVDYRNFIDLLTSSGGRIAPSSPRSLSPRLSRSSSKMDRK